MANSRICSVEECGKPSRCYGWCGAHYMRWKRHGSPTAGAASQKTKYGEPLEFLKSTVLTYSGDECLSWPYSADTSGYGKLWINGRCERVHRLACEYANGPAPAEGLYAAHSCGNGHLGCCNPGHLRWATPAENAADTDRHGRFMRGEACSYSKLTWQQVADIRDRVTGMSQTALAKEYGVSRSLVSLIVKGRIWKTSDFQQRS